MIIVDLEMSGIEVEKYSILSIGALDFENQENTFYGECRLMEGTSFDPQALRVNGFSEDHIKKCKTSCEELVKEFYVWSKKIKERTLGGQNPGSMDIPFLKKAFDKYNFSWIYGHRIVDSHSLAYGYFRRKGMKIPLKEGTSGLSLDFLIEYFNLEKRDVHNALEDAKLTAEVIKRVLV